MKLAFFAFLLLFSSAPLAAFAQETPVLSAENAVATARLEAVKSGEKSWSAELWLRPRKKPDANFDFGIQDIQLQWPDGVLKSVEVGPKLKRADQTAPADGASESGLPISFSAPNWPEKADLKVSLRAINHQFVALDAQNVRLPFLSEPIPVAPAFPDFKLVNARLLDKTQMAQLGYPIPVAQTDGNSVLVLVFERKKVLDAQFIWKVPRFQFDGKAEKTRLLLNVESDLFAPTVAPFNRWSIVVQAPDAPFDSFDFHLAWDQITPGDELEPLVFKNVALK